MQVAYTFAKSLDVGSYADADSATEQDPYNLLQPEYARSDFNQTHLLRINGVWDLPQFKNLGFVRCGSRDSWARKGYFSTAAYVAPPTGTFGNSGRNSLVGPSYFDTDISLVKNLAYLKRDGANIQLRGDFFNLFNNVPFNNPVATNTSAVFGKVTAAGNARQVQVALRVSF